MLYIKDPASRYFDFELFNIFLLFHKYFEEIGYVFACRRPPAYVENRQW